MRDIPLSNQPISYIPFNLAKPIDGPYIVTPTGHRKVLLSNVYGEGKSVTLKVVSDLDSYVTFKKDKAVGLAEAISIMEDRVTYRSKMQQQPNAAPCERKCSELPEHLQTMYYKNISGLSLDQQIAFKNLLIEFSDVFSRDDFDHSCLKGGIEHKIITHDYEGQSEITEPFLITF